MQEMNIQQCSHSLQDLKALMSKLGIQIEKNGKLRASGMRVITRCSKKSFAGKKRTPLRDQVCGWMGLLKAPGMQGRRDCDDVVFQRQSQFQSFSQHSQTHRHTREGGDYILHIWQS